MRNVTIKQLRLLRAAAHGGSLAAAAEECHVTPSAVTMQMHQLETVAGLPLIERQRGRGFNGEVFRSTNARGVRAGSSWCRHRTYRWQPGGHDRGISKREIRC